MTARFELSQANTGASTRNSKARRHIGHLRREPPQNASQTTRVSTALRARPPACGRCCCSAWSAWAPPSAGLKEASRPGALAGIFLTLAALAGGQLRAARALGRKRLRRSRPAPVTFAIPAALIEAGPRRAQTKETTMKTSMMIAAGLSAFALWMTSGGAPNARAEGAGVSRDEKIAGCVKNREKSFECKDPFIEAMIDLRASRGGKPPTGDQRAKMKAKGLEEIEADGSGPLAPRQAKCAAMVDKMDQTHNGDAVTKTHLDALDKCYAEQDCPKRVACMMPILGELMFTKKK
jgi:hypothetical protein